MADKLVLGTTAPHALRGCAEDLAARAPFRVAQERVAVEVDPDGRGRKCLVTNSTVSSSVVGLEILDGDIENPPKGWRVETWGRRGRMLVPIKRSNAGKETHARLTSIKVGGPRLPGMPMDFVSNKTSRWYHPGLWKPYDTLYATWSGDVTVEDLQKGSWGVPLGDIWTPVKLSVYYADRERWYEEHPDVNPSDD